MFKKSLANSFTPAIRGEGAELYAQHAINSFFSSSSGMSLRVLDGISHVVRFERRDEKCWQPQCPCQEFKAKGQCRHLWAVLLFLDSEIGKKPRIKLWMKSQKIESKVGTWFARSSKSSGRNSGEIPDAGLKPWREEWEYFVAAMQEADSDLRVSSKKKAVARELALVLSPKKSRTLDRLVFNIYARDSSREKFKKARINASDAKDFPEDRELLEFFLDLEGAHGDPTYPRTSLELNNLIFPRDRMQDWLVELTRREKVFASLADLQNGKSADFIDRTRASLEYIVESGEGDGPRLDIRISDSEVRLYCDRDELLVLSSAYVLSGRSILQIPPLDERGKVWLNFIENRLTIDSEQCTAFLEKVETLIPLAATKATEPPNERSRPRPSLSFSKKEIESDDYCEGILSFTYGRDSSGGNANDLPNHLAEEAFRKSLFERPEISRISPNQVSLASPLFPELAQSLITQGWGVYLDTRALSVSSPRYALNKSKNWLELKLKINDIELDIGAITRTIKRKNLVIELSDGSSHLVDPKAQRTLSRLLSLLQRKDSSWRLDPVQTPLIDQLLKNFEANSPSPVLEDYHKTLSLAQSVDSSQLQPSPHFTGSLRSYQLAGFRWLEQMTRSSFGVCLADEMGLGKTIQILALLDLRREPMQSSLIIVPRSLIGNWKAEIVRFAPQMKVLDYSGTKREFEQAEFDRWNIVLTTYGVLLQEDPALMHRRWQHVILDEAQAIKNHSTLTAQAAHRLTATYRVALSGTPLENNSSELISLFRFLNPGMIGPSSENVLLDAMKEPEASHQITRSLRPFILRRRKEDVVFELPPKIINILSCEMGDGQTKLYAEYLIFYRAKIAEEIAEKGFGKSKLLMIEALLRLRQISCHPALVRPEETSSESTKIEMLMEKLDEIKGSADKVLIFSQFTNFLRLIEVQLRGQGITYEYLDGQTRDRSERVKRFQEDPAVKVFLISLKAGGVGLNLTAARYAFIMDPWWNPAVEEQAMARAHRIGQAKQVIIYKLVVKDTIEEKILDLQTQKSDLIRDFMDEDEQETGGSGLLQTITPRDLELLMS